MTYSLLRFAHLVGVMLMGAGLIGVWLSDLRSRQVRDLVLFAEAVRNIAAFYDGVVVPGALILFVSRGWMTAEVWGGWEFVQEPWLTGMIVLFLIEFIEGNTITRLYFMRLRRLTNEALVRGAPTPELTRARQAQVPTFTHFLDISMLLVIVSLGAIRARHLDPIHHRHPLRPRGCRRSNGDDTAPLPLGPADTGQAGLDERLSSFSLGHVRARTVGNGFVEPFAFPEAAEQHAPRCLPYTVRADPAGLLPPSRP